MKHKAAIKKYFVKRRNRISYFLKLRSKNYKPGTFHKLRTEIKKINAVFNILNDCTRKFKRENTFKPLKLIFNIAGNVRDMQVKAALMKRYKISSGKNGLAVQLQKELKKAKEKFNNQVTEKIKNRSGKNLASASEIIGKLKDKNINGYYKKAERKIRKLLKQQFRQSKLHELRKQLKVFYYNLNAGDWSRHDVPFDKMDAIQELLGKWHDGRIAVKYIDERMREDEILKSKKARLNKIKLKLRGDVKKMVKPIEEQSKSLRFRI